MAEVNFFQLYGCRFSVSAACPGTLHSENVMNFKRVVQTMCAVKEKVVTKMWLKQEKDVPKM